MQSNFFGINRAENKIKFLISRADSFVDKRIFVNLLFEGIKYKYFSVNKILTSIKLIFLFFITSYWR